ncbi:MAG: FtsX-like permease family protein [Dehalococcoidia bacterium]|nr:FtsX-like permease family protein [Dehalococcoidia bacterium]
MSPIQTIKTAIASLGANKLRAGLALLGIVIGVTAVITLMSIGRGTTEQITGIIQGLGTNLLFVQPEGEGQLTLGDANALVDPVYAPTVLASAPEIRTFATLVAGRDNTNAQVVGVTPVYLTARNLDLASGMFIKSQHVDNRDEVIVLGSNVAEQLFQNRDPVGEYVRVNARRYRVIGLLESQGGGGFGTFDTQVLIPITTAYYRLSGERTLTGDVAVNLINVQVRDLEDIDRSIEETSGVLRLRHRITEEDDFTVISQQSTIETLEETTNTLVVFLGIIAGISLLVGGIGIMNIMLVSVTERTREIGIRKAMGAKRRDILFQFVAEATVLSIGGGLLGAAFGYWMTNAVDGQTLGTQTFNTSFSNEFAALALIVSAGIGLFFGIYPAVRASRLHPIDALRYE